MIASKANSLFHKNILSNNSNLKENEKILLPSLRFKPRTSQYGHIFNVLEIANFSQCALCKSHCRKCDLFNAVFWASTNHSANCQAGYPMTFEGAQKRQDDWIRNLDCNQKRRGLPVLLLSYQMASPEDFLIHQQCSSRVSNNLTCTYIYLSFTIYN